jgi:hypothetical protein
LINKKPADLKGPGPTQHRGDGSERISGDGYIEIKNRHLKHRLKAERILNQNTGSYMNEHGPIRKIQSSNLWMVIKEILIFQI